MDVPSSTTTMTPRHPDATRRTIRWERGLRPGSAGRPAGPATGPLTSGSRADERNASAPRGSRRETNNDRKRLQDRRVGRYERGVLGEGGDGRGGEGGA